MSRHYAREMELQRALRGYAGVPVNLPRGRWRRVFVDAKTLWRRVRGGIGHLGR